MGTQSACRCTPQKIRYRDEIAAKLALAAINRQDASGRAKVEKRAYNCPCCRGWHLTAKPVDTKPRGGVSSGSGVSGG